MNKNKKWMLSFLLLTFSMFFTWQGVFASEFNFSVTPVTPESQIDDKITYFDIMLAPEKKETLAVELRNDTDNEVKVAVSLNATTTNSNVVVEYGKNTIEKDPSLAIDLTEHVEYPDTVTLKSHSTQTVFFNVTMPEEVFDGVLAGGITFKEILAENQAEKSDSQGLSIKNEYSYVVALLMRQNQKEVVPNLALHDIEPGQINARNVILANVQNDQKTYINQVAIATKITKKNSDEVLYQEDKTGLQIAPNTNFSFPTALKGASLEPGDYHLSMVVLGNEDEHGEFSKEINGEKVIFKNEWEFDKDFHINGEIAKELNEKDVTIKKDYTWLYILIGLLLLLLALVLILWLIWKKKKNEKEE